MGFMRRTLKIIKISILIYDIKFYNIHNIIIIVWKCTYFATDDENKLSVTLEKKGIPLVEIDIKGKV